MSKPRLTKKYFDSWRKNCIMGRGKERRPRHHHRFAIGGNLMDQRELTEKYVPNDDIYLFNTGGARMAYLTFGCRYIPDCGMHRFVVWAPQRARGLGRRRLQRLGRLRHPMYRREDGVWCAFIPGVKQGDIYKYRVVGPGRERRAQGRPLRLPRRDRPRHGQQGLGHRGLAWQDGKYLAARAKRDALRSPMSIYEVHLGSWRVSEGETFPNYRSVADELADYCKRHGLHARGAAAHHGVPLRRLLGLSGDGLFRAHEPLRHAAGLHVLRGQAAQRRHRRHHRLGARALPARRARPAPVRRRALL